MLSYATVIFFKESGKYYTEELYEIKDTDAMIQNVMDDIIDRYRNYCTGMHMVVTFDDLYSHGYPQMVPADRR